MLDEALFAILFDGALWYYPMGPNLALYLRRLSA